LSSIVKIVEAKVTKKSAYFFVIVEKVVGRFMHKTFRLALPPTLAGNVLGLCGWAGFEALNCQPARK